MERKKKRAMMKKQIEGDIHFPAQGFEILKHHNTFL